MGLIAFHLTSTFMGLQQFIMPTSLFIRHPMLWLTKTAEHRATQLYAPNFAYKYLLDSYNPLTFEAIDLSSVRFIMNGAEPISPSLCLHFLEEMSPYGLASNTMLTAYGLAEATVGVSFGEVGDLKTYVLDRRYLETGKPFIETELHDEHAVSFVEVGKPIQYCEVRICDDQDKPVSDLILGSIQIKGLSVTKDTITTLWQQRHDNFRWLATDRRYRVYEQRCVGDYGKKQRHHFHQRSEYLSA